VVNERKEVSTHWTMDTGPRRQVRTGTNYRPLGGGQNTPFETKGKITLKDNLLSPTHSNI